MKGNFYKALFGTLDKPVGLKKDGSALYQIIHGIRRPNRWAPGAFEAMKPDHPGFPGGRAQEYFLDLETQGLRTSRWDRWLGVPARRDIDALELSQVSFARKTTKGLEFILGDAEGQQKAFTDIINPELLQQHKIGSVDDLAGKHASPFLNALSQQNVKGYWDSAIHVEGNTLRGVLERHVQHVVQGGETQKSIGYVDQMLSTMLKDIDSGENVHLSGWNVGFDWGRIREVAQGDERVMRKVRRLMTAQAQGTFKIQDKSRHFKSMVWDAMVADPSVVPSFTDYAKLEQVVKKGGDPKHALVEHSAMRDFMDVMSESDDAMRQSRLHSRFTDALEAGADPHLAQELTERLSGVRTYADWEEAAHGLKQTDDHTRALRNLFERGFKPHGGKMSTRHMSLLGAAGRGDGVLDTGFSFVLGWKQENVAEALVDVLPETQANELRELMKRGVHDSDIDVLLSEQVGRHLEDIAAAGPNDTRFKALIGNTIQNTDAMASDVSARMQLMLQLKREVANAQANQSMDAARAINKVDDMKGNKGIWLAGMMAASGLYMLQSWNQSPEEIEVRTPRAVRQPTSYWDQISGIDPSQLHKANVSDFGSGRDVFTQLLGGSYSPNIDWVPASALGMRGKQLDSALGEYESGHYQNTAGPGTPSRFQETVMLGNYYHSVATHMFGDAIESIEYPVRDPYLKVSGRVDAVLKSGIPLEIKTVETAEDVMQMREGKPTHVSQANFYAYALNQPYAYLGYFARDNPQVFRFFRVPVDHNRLMQDYAASQTSLGELRDKGMTSKVRKDFQSIPDRIYHDFMPFSEEGVHYVDHDHMVMPGVAPGALNPIPAMDRPGDFAHLLRQRFQNMGYGGFVQNAGRMNKSKIADKFRRSADANPAMRPFVRTTTRRTGVHASRVEACAC